MSFAAAQIGEQDIRTISSVRGGLDLGALGVTPDGRVYRWAKAGGTALDPGKLTVNADVDSDVVNKTVAATVAAGATSVTLDAAGAVTADFYKGGYLVVSDATGEGVSYLVEGNQAVSGAAELTVALAEPLKVGLTVDVSEVTLIQHDLQGVVISATDQADQPMGVPNVTVTADYFCWLQTGGSCAVLADEAVTKGLALTIGTGVAGAVEALDAAGEFQIGVASMALVDTEYRPASLTLN
jgi:hypothetical protein